MYTRVTKPTVDVITASGSFQYLNSSDFFFIRERALFFLLKNKKHKDKLVSGWDKAEL